MIDGRKTGMKRGVLQSFLALVLGLTVLASSCRANIPDGTDVTTSSPLFTSPTVETTSAGETSTRHGETTLQEIESSATEQTAEQTTSSPVVTPVVRFTYTKFTEEVFLIGEAARAYLAAAPERSIQSVVEPYRLGERLDHGEAVTLSYELTDLLEGVAVSAACIEVAEDASYGNAIAKDARATGRARFINLKTGTTYHYRITVTLSDGTVFVGEDTFTTAKTPRLLTVGGIYNVRDIGGWETSDGRRIRQGVLYRGTELDGAVEKAYTLTAEGKKELRSLGICMDMDLRSSEVNLSGEHALGDNIKHIYYDAAMYGGIFSEMGKETMRQIFSDLAKPQHYPMYLHCTYGCDRTGTVCMLLEALLGVGKADLIRDYELSGLYASQFSRNNYGGFMTALEALPGATLQKKVENYLLSIGVTEQEIESIRTIFLSE